MFRISIFFAFNATYYYSEARRHWERWLKEKLLLRASSSTFFLFSRVCSRLLSLSFPLKPQAYGGDVYQPQTYRRAVGLSVFEQEEGRRLFSLFFFITLCHRIITYIAHTFRLLSRLDCRRLFIQPCCRASIFIVPVSPFIKSYVAREFSSRLFLFLPTQSV